MKVIGAVGKVIGIIVLVLFVLFILFLIVVTLVTKSNDAYKGDYKLIVKKSDSSAPKALLVYQPAKSKASAEIADQMAKGLNEAGYEVTLTYPGKHISSDLSKYSVIAFGTPVFFGKPSAAITGTIKRLSDYSNKTVVIYSVGQLADSPELELVKESFNGIKPDYCKKFITKENSYKQDAYELGLKVGKENGENK